MAADAEGETGTENLVAKTTQRSNPAGHHGSMGGSRGLMGGKKGLVLGLVTAGSGTGAETETELARDKTGARGLLFQKQC